MAVKTNPAKYILPLYINRLEGRMLFMPAPSKAGQEQLLFIYGHHSNLERWWGLMQILNSLGSVTMPDLPGFGGMDSFYKIGEKPSIDTMADYLAAFFRLRFHHKRVIVVGMGYGFVLITRMLQRYPELKKNVKLLVSIGGVADSEDFSFSKSKKLVYSYVTGLFARRLPASVFKVMALNGPMIRLVYAKTSKVHHKTVALQEPINLKILHDVEVGLWHGNDLRTYMYTTNEFLKFSNCDRRVDLPVHYVSAKKDHLIDHNRIEQHMRVIFTDFHPYFINSNGYASTLIASRKEAAGLIPKDLVRIIRGMS